MGKYQSSSCVRKIKNSVGDETYSVWRGLLIVKKKIQENKSNTLAQQQQQARLAAAYDQSGLFAPALELGTPRRPRVQTLITAFISMNTNKKVFVVGEEPDEEGKLEVTVNYPAIRCSKGRLRMPRNMAVTKNAGELSLSFSHLAEQDGPDRYATDKVYALVVETEIWDSELFDLGTRADGEPVQVTLPEGWNMDAIHIYAFVVTQNGKTASNSLYLTAE